MRGIALTAFWSTGLPMLLPSWHNVHLAGRGLSGLEGILGSLGSAQVDRHELLCWLDHAPLTNLSYGTEGPQVSASSCSALCLSPSCSVGIRRNWYNHTSWAKRSREAVWLKALLWWTQLWVQILLSPLTKYSLKTSIVSSTVRGDSSTPNLTTPEK